MKILYSPQFNNKKIAYEFGIDKITAHYDGKKEVFDFSHLGNGKLENGVDSIEVETLPINPIMGAERVNGELRLTLLYYHGIDATNAELFPEWKDAKDLEVGVYGKN